ncbi:MAG: NusG domain II-containing protein [Endomicrobiales bacterium]
MRRNPGDNPAFFKISGPDLLLAGMIVALSLFFLQGITSARSGTSPGRASVYVEGKLTREIPLSQDGTIMLPGLKYGNGLQLEVKGGKIRVSRSECPKHLCSHQGNIQYPGQTLVCVPNRVLVEIKSSSPLLDAVVQ